MGRESLRDALSYGYTRAYKASDLQPGDVVAYTGKAAPGYRTTDLLRVTQVKGKQILAERVHPLDWERGVEFSVVQQQLETHGVIVVTRAE